MLHYDDLMNLLNPSIFSQAVDETFPNLDQSLREEIKVKVTAHMIELLKEKVFTNDAEGLIRLDQISKNEPDKTKQAQLFMKYISEKLLSLSPEEQETINKELDTEFTQVMRKIYKAYE
jgi:hypothetical protein